jgi:hypothetical protein
MDNGNGLSAADVALLNNDGMGGWNGMIWLFAILALMGGGFGGWGNNGFANALGYENLATSNEVQRGFDNQNLQAQTRDILSAVTGGTAQAVAATNQTFHDTVNAISDKYGELQRDLAGLAVGQANLLAKQNECCCETKQMIMQNNYDGAMRDAATNANISAQIQGVKDMLQQNKIEALQAEVSKLQLAQATNGMLRFPDQWTYGAGQFPPIFGGCCGQQNI